MPNYQMIYTNTNTCHDNISKLTIVFIHIMPLHGLWVDFNYEVTSPVGVIGLKRVKEAMGEKSRGFASLT